MTIALPDRCIFTLGHSTHEQNHFLSLLKQYKIDCVVDVRSMPYSRWQPQYNREALAAALKRNEIEYDFLGAELGARSDDRRCYNEGKVVYNRLAASAGFKAAIDKLSSNCNQIRVVLVCAEQEPLECHRTILVSRALEMAGTRVVHILSDGRTERHSDTMLRLLKLLKMPEIDLFHTTEEIIDDAYERQEQRIAYIDREQISSEPAQGAFA